MIKQFVCAAGLFLGLIASVLGDGGPSPSDVFRNGEGGYPAYRIPALVVSGKGRLLAFAEGRKNLRDHAENDIVLRRSTNNGTSWESLQVVAEDGTNSLNNPTAVVIRENGRVFLVYQRYLQGFDERKAEPGYESPRVCRTYLVHSDNDGVTWSEPREITRGVKRPREVTGNASGPGFGIQLSRGKHAGRILIPFNQGPYGKWKVYAAYSDDLGNSWKYGETAPEGGPGYANEVQFAELSDGRVMLNARNQNGEKVRKVAFSSDGGTTWSATITDPALIEPACQASILMHPTGSGNALLFSNPGSTTARTNGIIRMSLDEGKSWPVSRVIYPGSFAYSCLGSLQDGRVACLFERDGYSKISIAIFSVDWVKGK
jgi:sialidase-1